MVFAVGLRRGDSSDQQQGDGGQHQNQSGDDGSRAKHGRTYVGSQRGMGTRKGVEIFLTQFGLSDWGSAVVCVTAGRFIFGAISYWTAPIIVVPTVPRADHALNRCSVAVAPFSAPSGGQLQSKRARTTAQRCTISVKFIPSTIPSSGALLHSQNGSIGFARVCTTYSITVVAKCCHPMWTAFYSNDCHQFYGLPGSLITSARFGCLRARSEPPFESIAQFGTEGAKHEFPNRHNDRTVSHITPLVVTPLCVLSARQE
jgi:hypothetical protein